MASRPPMAPSVLSPRMTGMTALSPRAAFDAVKIGRPFVPKEEANGAAKNPVGSSVDRSEVLSHSDEDYEPDKTLEDDEPPQEEKRKKGPLPRGNSAIFFKPYKAAGDDAADAADQSAAQSQSEVLPLSDAKRDSLLDSESFVPVNVEYVEPLEKKEKNDRSSGAQSREVPLQDKPERSQDSESGAMQRVKSASNAVPISGPAGGHLPGMSMSFLKKRESLQNVVGAAKAAAPGKTSSTNSRQASTDKSLTGKGLEGLRRSHKGAVAREVSKPSLHRSDDDLGASEDDPDGGLKKRGVSGWLKKHFGSTK